MFQRATCAWQARTKALRAKKVSELINTSSNYAEVTLYIDGEKQYEIKRAIKVDGNDVKTLYRINGKRSTRTLVMEELRQYGLESGTHNIIAQGQVQKIVEMSAKERRGIIDSVAGIAEYDQKKDEAMRELDAVGQKITEASIVLGEREAILTELEREKNDALSYMEAQGNFKRSKASLTNAEFAKLSKQHADSVSKHAEAKAALEEFSKQAAALSGRISELESQKQQVVAKMGASASREAAYAEISQLKESISADAATLGEKKKEEQRLESMGKAIISQTEDLKKLYRQSNEAIDSLTSQIKSLTKQIADLERRSGALESPADELTKNLEQLSEKIVSLKEQKAANATNIENAERMLSMKKKEKETLSSAVGEVKESKLSGEQSILKKDVLSLTAALESLFEKEKELNRQIPDLDRRLLSLKEKAATLRASVSPAAANMALRAVEEMKQGGMRGIHGTVSSLVNCDTKYATAVEAATGQRLMNIVVDRMDTAIKVIEKLKEQKSGRCTFIPLDMPKIGVPDKMSGVPGCLGLLLDFVEFDAAYDQAMHYVFGDTLLFDNVQNAKKAGIGKARMVSLDGELIEKSGIITGGTMRGSLLSKTALDKAESDAESVKKQKDELYSQLYSLREEMNNARKEKATAEVKLAGIEIEIKTTEERKQGSKKAYEALAQIESEVEKIAKEISSLKKTADSLAASISQSIAEHVSLKGRMATQNEKEKQEGSEAQVKLREMHSSRSSFEAQLAAKKEELTRTASATSEKAEEEKQNVSSLNECRKDVSTLASKIAKTRKEQEEKEDKLAEISASSQKLISRMNEVEGQIKEIGGQLGRIRAEEEKKSRESFEISTRRETIETRLADLKAELDRYAGIQTIDATRTELEDMMKKAQAVMDAHPQVNLKAPEMYDQKKKDIEEIHTRVSSLDSEKNAVMHMMDEIEAKKRAIFLTTFNAVNENFKKLYGYIFTGEGTMLLEQPSSPFESGLLVKVHDGSHDKYLESMSGGEKSLLALIFIFAIQMHKAAPFYILDEADAALDKENSRKLSDLLRQLSKNTQFIVVTHNDTILSNADVALGVTRTDDGSKIVGVQLTQTATVARVKKISE
ncbi:MAG: AAA family ATPase [Candidatus Micrarchaeota archaeon]|nr:AAA family ATPase [Candidatus Micrarchaeota archaeon]